MSRVMPITGLLTAAMLATAPGATAQEPGASPWPNVRRGTGADTGATSALADTAYIRQAVHGNFLEVGLGRRAESRAGDSAVKEFARRMISDHNSMNQQWAALAQRNGMKIEMAVDSVGRQSGERLKDLSGAEFDRAYMAEMIMLHERDLAAFQRMTASARSPEVRQLAGSGVSTIRDHLSLARQVGSRVGVASTAARTGGVITPAQRPYDYGRDTVTGRSTRDEGDDRSDRDNRGGLRAEDRAFVRNVLQDHLMHIRLAERAQREAGNSQTRRFAERMEEDFEEWQERWEEVAGRYNLKAPMALGRLHGQKIEQLERASKRNFDRTYAEIVADHLESVVPYFQKEGKAVRSAAMRRLVEDELPLIQAHLSRARRLQAQASARAGASDRD